MLFQVLAGLVVLTHLGFVLFVVLGGFLTLRRPRLAWLHLPAAVWGALIEFGDFGCPLTHLEKYARERAGQAGYEGGFIQHYLMPILYPAGLTREWQIALASFVVLLNLAVYAVLVSRRLHARRDAGAG